MQNMYLIVLADWLIYKKNRHVTTVGNVPDDMVFYFKMLYYLTITLIVEPSDILTMFRPC